MIYTVIWQNAALAALADLWLSGADRQAIVAASHRIDQLLRTDPLDRGESRQERRRVLIEWPLAVTFEVDEGDRKVFLLDVWLMTRRP